MGHRWVILLDVAGRPARARRALFPAQDRPNDVLCGERRSVVVRDRDKLVRQRATQSRLQDRRHLRTRAIVSTVEVENPPTKDYTSEVIIMVVAAITKRSLTVPVNHWRGGISHLCFHQGEQVCSSHFHLSRECGYFCHSAL